MTTKQKTTETLELDAVQQNAMRVVQHCQDAMQEFIKAQGKDAYMAAPAMSAAKAFMALFEDMLENPTRYLKEQVELYHAYMRLFSHTALRFLGEESTPITVPGEKDKRFRDALWTDNVLFDFVKQSYLLTSGWMQDVVHHTEGVDEKTQKKLDFYTRQCIDAMAPSNFILTNPEVLRKTIETKGENLVEGLKNLLEDLERSKGALKVEMTDEKAFKVGKNLASTPGKVVFENALVQLIQYTPTTKQVHQTPLLIVSPWINKYYVLDMQPENSLVKWLVDQGHTVFITSWVNPTKALAKTGFADYMTDGVLACLDAVEQATGEKQTNVVGYCIGGTLMAATLSYLTAKKQADRVRSVTYFTTLVDFSEPGELGVFMDEEQISAMEEKMTEQGYLDADDMALAFNLLRANDLIWSFVVNNYLLGNQPFPFDLLYWNADSTRLPATMHSFYLRKMYLENQLVKKGGITLNGVPIDLKMITTPTYILSTREDHIAPWEATYKATQLYGGKVRFVLSGSGHIAGVVNPPAKKKYGYWTPGGGKQKNPASPEAWFKAAKEHAGSWWEDWDQWMQKEGFVGKKVAPRTPGEGKLKAIEEAPGRYVKVKSR